MYRDIHITDKSIISQTIQILLYNNLNYEQHIRTALCLLQAHYYLQNTITKQPMPSFTIVFSARIVMGSMQTKWPSSTQSSSHDQYSTLPQHLYSLRRVVDSSLLAISQLEYSLAKQCLPTPSKDLKKHQSPVVQC